MPTETKRHPVSICIPTLGRPRKLARLLRMIEANAEWPYEVIVRWDEIGPGRRGCPTVLAECVAASKHDFVCYLGNDVIPQPGFLRAAMECMARWFPEMDGLVGLADQYWLAGELATHWVASKNLLPMLGGEFFYHGYSHTCCDSELTERCRMANKYVWCEEAKVFHDHPIRVGFQSGVDHIYEIAYDPELRARDRDLLLARAKEYGFPIRENFRPPLIPRKVWTAWIGDSPMPEMVKRCIESQKKYSLGWDHVVIDSTNYPKGLPYVEAALRARKWVKAVDYLKFWLLHEHGGVWMDADVELLKPLPDFYRADRMFAGIERLGWIGNGVIGAERGHPILAECLRRVEERFRGDDDKNFESSVQLLTETVYEMGVEANGVRLYPPQVFTPYDHQGKKEEVTEDTVTYHHFMVTWGYPNVSANIDLRTRLGEVSDKVVLNVGLGRCDSGIGKQLVAYPIRRLDNVEIHAPYIETARRQYWVAKEVRFYHADICGFPLDGYDAILMADVLEHIQKDAAIELIRKAQATGARVVVFLPLENRLQNERDGVDMSIPSEAHVSLWTEDDFRDLGFTTERLVGFHKEKGEEWDALWAVWEKGREDEDTGERDDQRVCLGGAI